MPSLLAVGNCVKSSYTTHEGVGMPHSASVSAAYRCNQARVVDIKRSCFRRAGQSRVKLEAVLFSIEGLLDELFRG